MARATINMDFTDVDELAAEMGCSRSEVLQAAVRALKARRASKVFSEYFTASPQEKARALRGRI